MSTPVDLVLLGNLIVDDLVFADGRTRMAEPGGALLHTAFAATAWGLRTGCVGPLGDDYPPAALAALRTQGARLDGLVAMHRPGLRAWILYEPGGRQIVHRQDGPSHEAASPTFAQVPLEWHSARAFHLAPMPFECQLALVEALRAHGARDAFISVDPHEPVTPATLPRWRALLAQVDSFFPSEDEWRLAAGDDPREALASLAGGRLRYVLVKRGAQGGLAYDARADRLVAWSARAGRVVDPTGAGDAFAMGFVSACLDGVALHGALERALVGASFALEGWGSEALATARRADADARLAAWNAEEEAR